MTDEDKSKLYRIIRDRLNGSGLSSKRKHV